MATKKRAPSKKKIVKPKSITKISNSPHWVFPEGTVTGATMTNKFALVSLEQNSQAIEFYVENNDLNALLWEVVIGLSKGDLVFASGRFPALDADLQYNMLEVLRIL